MEDHRVPPRTNRSAYRLASFLTGLLLTALLAACLAPSSPAQQSKFGVEDWFPNDAKAQELAVAAELGRADEVRRLMKVEGVNPDKLFTSENLPLLIWPIYTQNQAGLKALLENGANPNARFPTPKITKHKDGSVGVSYSNNAMVWAAKEDDPIYLKLLLDHGGDPNTRNSNNETLLVQSILGGGGWPNVKLLVERGADVNAKTRTIPFISEYAMAGGFEPTYWLLQRGANPDNDSEDPRYKFTINSIFWYPSKPGYVEWQRKCQQWLLARGYKRPPMPEHLRRMRKSLGYPHEEKDIPLL